MPRKNVINKTDKVGVPGVPPNYKVVTYGRVRIGDCVRSVSGEWVAAPVGELIRKLGLVIRYIK